MSGTAYDWNSIGLTRMTSDDCTFSASAAFLFQEAIRGQTETRSFRHESSPSPNAEVVSLSVR